MEEKRKKTPWSSSVGKVHCSGDARVASFLREAFAIPGFSFGSSPMSLQKEREKLGMHLFHSYSARTNPLVVRKLLSQGQKGDVVLDPFVGSGTTLVEALIAGKQGVGCDLSELAVRLTRLKTYPLDKKKQNLLLQTGQQLLESSKEAIAKKVKPPRRYDDSSHYEPHVYLELCNLRHQIELLHKENAPAWLIECLLLIFSSILNKALKETPSSEEMRPRTLSKGRVSTWFFSRVEEMVVLEQWLCAKVPPGYILPEVFVHDARQPFSFMGTNGPCVDVIITSPPYLGVYDYAFQQARRQAFLGIDAKRFFEGEMGAKRFLTSSTERQQLITHQKDTNNWLKESAKWLRPGGFAYVVVGDSILEQVHPGQMPIIQAAPAAGLEFVASCSIEKSGRRDFMDEPPTSEHLLAFIKKP